MDRRVRVLYQEEVSKWLKSKLGMPQGAVSSPPLWNLFSFDLKVVAAELAQSLADDFHGASSSNDIQAIETNLNAAAAEMVDWADKNVMSISAPKSTVTLFTPWTRQVNIQLDVKVGDETVPTIKCPRLLGVILDPLYTFSHHAVSIARRASSRMNIMRALSDSAFGKDKECLTQTFGAFIRPLFDYCAPVVYPIYSPSSIERLQRVQNRALRLASGCHAAAAVEHLHAETKELPVKDHLHLLSAQYLARFLQIDHVTYPFAQVDNGPRKLKHTLRSKCLADVEPYLEVDGSLGRGNFPRVKNQLHTDIVRKALENTGPNRVLGVRPPPIHASETSLPRISRTTLSQLRSGHCARLKVFQVKIGKTDDDSCPDCNLFSQSVNHLFDCPARPTTLRPIDLWENPRDVVDHLRSTSSFDSLPPLGSPPRPRRRPRPPRAPPDVPPISPGSPPGSPLFSPLILPPSQDLSPRSNLSSQSLFSAASTPPLSPNILSQSLFSALVSSQSNLSEISSALLSPPISPTRPPLIPPLMRPLGGIHNISQLSLISSSSSSLREVNPS